MGNAEKGTRNRARRKPVISNSIEGVTRKELIVLGSRGLLAVFAGKVAAEGMAPVLERVSHVVEELGYQPGNAGVNEELLKNCGSSPNPQLCAKKFVNSEPTYTMLTIVDPALEELIYRLTFSAAQSIVDKRDPIHDTAIGTGNPLLSRGEMFTCLLSTIMFCIGHNRISNGDYNTNIIPIKQFFAGIGYSYLQRVFGVFSNLTAHILMNIYAIERM